MQISERQMALLTEAVKATFVRRCIASLHREHPAEAAAYSEAALKEHVVTRLQHLEDMGITYTDHMEQALLMLFSYQHRPNRPPIPEDLVARLRDPHATPEKKLEALEQMAIFG
jgi:hypothetical protein